MECRVVCVLKRGVVSVCVMLRLVMSEVGDEIPTRTDFRGLGA